MSLSAGARVALLLCLLTPAPAPAQNNPGLRQAQVAYDSLDYAGAVTGARLALQQSLSREDRIVAFELLGFAYGALDSTVQAVRAFQDLIFLAPDREPSLERVSPRITSLYASALGQVLVVRRVSVDSTSFVAGRGEVPIRFDVSRPAMVSTRVLGPGTDVIIDTVTMTGPGRVNWTVTVPDSRPLPPGDYQIIITARESSRSEYSSEPLAVRVAHSTVDTLPHLAELPGYREQPEMVSPPRDWRPLALAALYTGLATGVFFALDERALGAGARTGMLSVGGAAVAVGLGVSLRRSEPRPSQTNILYNRLLRELLARRNVEIARDNAERRSQVLLTVVPSR
jgi:hypothetical protein